MKPSKKFDVCILITSYFPPSRLPAARRPFLFALRLVRCGVPVLIKNGSGWQLCSTTQDLLAFCAEPTDTGRIFKPGLLGLILRRIKNALVLPELLLGTLRGYAMVRSLPIRYLVDANDILVIGTTPPITAGFAGCVVKRWLMAKGKRVKLWFDYRDEWATNPLVRRPGISKLIATYCEELIVRSSDILTMVSKGLQNRMSYTRIRPTEIIYNGYDRGELDALVAVHGVDDDEISLLGLEPNSYAIYPGSFPRGLYCYQEFELLYRQLQEQNIKLVIAGGEADPSEGFFYANDLPNVTVIPRLKYSAFVELMKGSLCGVLFTLNGEPDGYITTKVFDYIALGLPIACSGKMNRGELREFLEVCGHTVLTIEDLPDLKGVEKCDGGYPHSYSKVFEHALSEAFLS